jgi:hypothetical protein
VFQIDMNEDEELFLSTMGWTVPQYDRKEVDQAGKILIADSSSLGVFELDNALAVINNWRSSHSFPLNTFQNNLRRHAKAIDSRSLIAQRIKRISSIELKLHLIPSLKLSQMQDIGGCRAIVHSVHKVRELLQTYEDIGFKHKLLKMDNYIDDPKGSGYRSIHLIYRYYSDRNETYNGLKIEMQLRSTLQHAWATAVETVGTFIRQALKSSVGEKDWLRFFALMGTAIAFREKTQPVPDTPIDKKELITELKDYSQRLEVVRRLKTYGAALKSIEKPAIGGGTEHFFLLHLDPSANQVTVYGYKLHELEEATKQYLQIEKSIASQHGAEAVLVSVESLEALRRAYPNYFLDTGVFIEALNKALSE